MHEKAGFVVFPAALGDECARNSVRKTDIVVRAIRVPGDVS